MFDDPVTLQPATQYWFLMAGGVPTALRFGTDLYAGGTAWQTSAQGTYIPLPGFDLNFTLQATQAETPEPASALLLTPALLALHRARRPHTATPRTEKISD